MDRIGRPYGILGLSEADRWFGFAGGRRLFEEKLSGVQRNRPELARLLDQVRDDDVLVVTRLDRLARSTRDLLDVAERLHEAGTGLRSLAEPWADTTSPAGRMVLTVFAGIVEFKRALIPGGTSAARAAAQQKGVRFGRPSARAPDQVALDRRLVEEGQMVRPPGAATCSAAFSAPSATPTSPARAAIKALRPSPSPWTAPVVNPTARSPRARAWPTPHR